MNGCSGSTARNGFSTSTTCRVRSTLRSADTDRLAALQAAFTASPWASRTPVDVEVPFEMTIGDVVVRGRIDAVFADPDGGATVVDWKTGEPPATDDELRPVGDSAGRVPAGLGGVGTAARNPRCGPHSTTCGRAAPSGPTHCRVPTNWPRC